jgi:hypothetical protein
MVNPEDDDGLSAAALAEAEVVLLSHSEFLSSRVLEFCVC